MLRVARRIQRCGVSMARGAHVPQSLLRATGGATWRYLSRGTVLHSSPPSTHSFAFDVHAIEDKWRARWRTPHAPSPDSTSSTPSSSSAYILSMFPYPSGNLHMGHTRVYTLSDALARFARMRQHDVVHPIGWDAFGLPAENAALERGVSPAHWTASNIASMRTQLESLGMSFDWSREVATCDSSYYRWTQWLFVQLHDAGLAYQKEARVNWDPVDHTVLANEQVDANGHSWRSGAKVEQRDLKQWFFRITEFAEPLLRGLDGLADGGKWPVQVCKMQEQWIGKSDGALVRFPVEGGGVLEAFTTRLDTLRGVSFVSVAPDHELAKQHASGEELAAMDEEDTAEGLPLGVSVRHPLTGEEVPVFAAPYVVSDYGSGAVMGVPAHDERDFVFAQRHGLPVKRVVEPADGSESELPFTDDGVVPDLDGKTSSEARAHFLQQLEREQLGQAHTQYRLRDWLVSRQRYWGAPIPVVHCDSCGAVPVPVEQLPVELPADLEFKGRRGNPLQSDEAKAWRETTCPTCNGPAERDTDTLDTFVDSSWYFARFIDPQNDKEPFSKELAARHWPVDTYIGGIEHAILHLLYARFISHFFHRLELVPSPEPFKELVTQGMVHGETFTDPDTGAYVKREDGEFDRDLQKHVHKETRKPLRVTWEKMSKSKYNGVEPAEILEQYGADTTRLFVLFKAPVENVLDWDDAAVLGQARWLNRVWELVSSAAGGVREEVDEGVARELRKARQAAIEQVTESFETRRMNLAVSSLMQYSNRLAKLAPKAQGSALLKECAQTLVLLLAPMAPHVTAEMWTSVLQGEGDVHAQTWPTVDEDMIEEASVPLVVQIRGKKRAVLDVKRSVLDEGNDALEQLAREHTDVQRHLADKAVRKVVVVKRKGKDSVLVNFVV